MKLVHHPSYERWGLPVEVADFTDDARPAVRVHAHCRNCGWKGEARFPVGYKIPLWSRCPKCERPELSAHGGFIARDEMTLDEERQKYEEYLEKMREHDRRVSKIRAEHIARDADANKRRRRFIR